MIDCHTIQGYFSSYMEKDLEGALREQVQQHFKTCHQCRDEYDVFVSSIELLSVGVSYERSGEFNRKVMQSISDLNQRQTQLKRKKKSFYWMLMAASVLFCLTFLGLDVLDRSRELDVDLVYQGQRLKQVDFAFKRIQGMPLVLGDQQIFQPISHGSRIKVNDFITAHEPTVIEIDGLGVVEVNQGDLLRVSQTSEGITRLVVYRLNYQIDLHDDHREITAGDLKILKNQQGSFGTYLEAKHDADDSYQETTPNEFKNLYLEHLSLNQSQLRGVSQRKKSISQVPAGSY